MKAYSNKKTLKALTEHNRCTVIGIKIGEKNNFNAKASSELRLHKQLRWWLHDPVLPGWNFNLSSRDRFHPTITKRNEFSSRQGGTGFHLVFVYKNHKFFLTNWRHMRRKNTIAITMIYWNVLLWIFSNWCVN